jgi:hypothetical protein
LAFLKIDLEAIDPNIQSIKAEAIGKAARWQGYEALEGLGNTRTINHSNAANPIIYPLNFTYLIFKT